MKRLVITIVANHDETQADPIYNAVAGFVPKLRSMGYADASFAISMDASKAPEPDEGINPAEHTVEELEELAPKLSEFDLRQAIVAEAIGDRRKTAIDALVDALKDLSDE